ncbi:Upf91.6 [Enterobacteria phage P7]|uniref:Upf91.6 n=1 Tax=Enterobacteria phage P7 TaxID=10682 RepID=Q1MVF2_BPP7|nr:Upf91.6 [Enterobacteria phage P7]AAQ07570.1 Upf91.6 [Enterobacteria phage P7]
MALLQVHNFVDNSGRKKWLSRTFGQTRCPGKSTQRKKLLKITFVGIVYFYPLQWLAFY